MECDLLHFQFQLWIGFHQRGSGFGKFSGRSKQRDLSVFALDVVDIHARIQHRFHDRIAVISFEGENCQVIKQMSDRSGHSELRAGSGEARTHVSDRAIHIVRQTVDNHRAAAGAETFIPNGGEVFARSAFCLLNRLLNDVAGNLLNFGTVNHVAQCRIVFRVWHTIFGRHIKQPAIL